VADGTRAWKLTQGPDQPEVWAVGDAYEFYVGRWSRLVAHDFIAWLGLGSNRRWLDVGCGTGSLTRTILEDAGSSEVVGIDPSDGFVARARACTPASLAEFQIGDAQQLPFSDASFDVAVAGLVLNFVLDSTTAIAEMRRVVRPGGTVAAYVWDYAGEMQLIRYFWDAAVALDSAAQELDEGRRFPICQPEPLRALFDNSGLDRTDVRAIDVLTVFKSFDDYWAPFLGGQGPAPAYCMALCAHRRDVLADRLKATLPTAPDGTIRLTARAFAVRGVRAIAD
jgi:SAM-dependent methyltransferase